MNCRELTKKMSKSPRWLEHLSEIVEKAVNSENKEKIIVLLPPEKKRYKRGYE